METTTKSPRFLWRAMISVLTAVSFLVVLVSGAVLFVAPSGRIAREIGTGGQIATPCWKGEFAAAVLRGQTGATPQPPGPTSPRFGHPMLKYHHTLAQNPFTLPNPSRPKNSSSTHRCTVSPSLCYMYALGIM